jgi:hypothetical protein
MLPCAGERATDVDKEKRPPIRQGTQFGCFDAARVSRDGWGLSIGSAIRNPRRAGKDVRRTPSRQGGRRPNITAIAVLIGQSLASARPGGGRAGVELPAWYAN